MHCVVCGVWWMVLVVVVVVVVGCKQGEGTKRDVDKEVLQICGGHWANGFV